MATVIIRNLPELAEERLRLRAVRAGNSMEDEICAILIRASLEEPPRAEAPASADVEPIVGLLGVDLPGHPGRVRPIEVGLVESLRFAGVEVDLDAPLSEDDE